MAVIKTEFDFKLPKGFFDPDTGQLHREGAMRLSTAADEILPLRDPRVQQNPAYLAVIVLSRVVTKLGSLQAITPRVIEGLFSADFSFLQRFYNQINEKPAEELENPRANGASASSGFSGGPGMGERSAAIPLGD